jgi:hypothetical protein
MAPFEIMRNKINRFSFRASLFRLRSTAAATKKEETLYKRSIRFVGVQPGMVYE